MTVTRVERADGTVVATKHHTDPGAATAEAAGLRWLAEPGAVAVPTVHSHDDEWLVIDYVTPAPATPAAADALGRGLASTHAASAPAFGSPPPGGPADAWIGRAPLRNVPGADWPSWYAAHRIEPYLRLAVDQGIALPDVARVADRVDTLAGPAEPPARLHGDLWNGNVLWSADGAWLIDPAAHGGHRETDLAMLYLFGCPHLDRIVAAYDETVPLADGWQARRPLHQLFPLLVHTVLFGGDYARRAAEAAQAALRG